MIKFDINKNKPFFFFLVTLSVTLILLGVYWSVSAKSALTKVHDPTPFATPAPVDSKDRYSVVFLGRGGEGHSGGTLTDSIIVLTVDTSLKRATTITIPRDLWVPVASGWDNLANFKINAAYNVGIDDARYANKLPEFKGEHGPGNLTKSVVEEVIGVPIDYYVDISFDRFVDLIGTLDGITVEVPKAFSDPFYPVRGLENETCGFSVEKFADLHTKYSGFQLERQFTCRYEELSFDKGQADLDGATALKFVRSRHGDSDFGRSERQVAVLEGILRKMISLDALTKTSTLIKDISSLVKTDLDLGTVASLLDIVGNSQEYGISKIYITEENLVNASTSADGQFILLPKAGNNNFEGIKNYIKERL